MTAPIWYRIKLDAVGELHPLYRTKVLELALRLLLASIWKGLEAPFCVLVFNMGE